MQVSHRVCVIGSATASQPGHTASTISQFATHPHYNFFLRQFNRFILARTLARTRKSETRLASDAGVPIDEPAVQQYRYATYAATVIEAWSKENLNPFRSPWIRLKEGAGDRACRRY